MLAILASLRAREYLATFPVHGTLEQVREQLEKLVTTGATHLLLNPVCRHAEQLEALAAIVGRR